MYEDCEITITSGRNYQNTVGFFFIITMLESTDMKTHDTSTVWTNQGKLL